MIARSHAGEARIAMLLLLMRERRCWRVMAIWQMMARVTALRLATLLYVMFRATT